VRIAFELRRLTHYALGGDIEYPDLKSPAGLHPPGS
jgi:hypothetical protein